MPLYEYHCVRCQRPFEALVARAGDPAPGCPHCGAADARRRLSTFAVTKSAPPAAPGPCGSHDCACRANGDAEGDRS